MSSIYDKLLHVSNRVHINEVQNRGNYIKNAAGGVYDNVWIAISAVT